MENYYDIIIIGGGPAGYTAAIYALRAGRKVLLIEKTAAGGQLAITSNIENYPGYSSIAGFELSEIMREQAVGFGLDELHGTVTECSLDSDIKTVTVKDTVYSSKSVIIATGAKAKKLGLESETKFAGRGVSYCATCDGMFFRNRIVAVNGGGDTAFEDALYLSGICKKVYIIHRRDSFRAADISVKKAMQCENIEFIYNSVVSDIIGNKRVEKLIVKNIKDETESEIEVSALFVAIGREPETDIFASSSLSVDDYGYIVAGEDTKTSINGVYACGDVRTKKLRQVVTACADGAVAGSSAAEYSRE